MKVRDLCVCDVSACTRDTSLARAGSLLRKHEIGALPVVDRSDRVIGLVTDRDIALELCRRNAPASEIFVDECMSERVCCCSLEDDVFDALELMKRNQVRRLPVVDEDGVLEGFLSIDDILCHAVEEGDGRELPYKDVIETLCAVIQPYQAEAARSRGAGPRGGSRYYRQESPDFENGGRRRGRVSRAEEKPARPRGRR